MGVWGDFSMYDDIYRICREVIENLKFKYRFWYKYDGYKFSIFGVNKSQFNSILDEYKKELNKIGLKDFLVVPLFWVKKRY